VTGVSCTPAVSPQHQRSELRNLNAERQVKPFVFHAIEKEELKNGSVICSLRAKQ